MSAGADMSVCSVHKTLGGPWWGTSIVLNGKNSKVSEKRFMQAHRALSTSSRSWGALADLEGIVVSHAEFGGVWFERIDKLMAKVKAEISKEPNVIIFNHADYCKEFDRQKLVVGIKGLTSKEMMETFYE